MKKRSSIAITSILTLFIAGTVNAQLYVTASVGGVPSVSGPTLETFDAPSPPILTLSGLSSLVTGWPYLFGGGAAFNSAPPLCSGGTLAYFGEPSITINGVSGFDGSQYVALGVGGSATLSFTTPEHFIGILWGTPDPSDALTFYDIANNVIGTVTGADIPGVPATIDPFSADSTFYVNVTSPSPFSRVVASSNTDSFEFDDVAYATMVPEPASTFLLGCEFCLLGLALRRKFMKSADGVIS
jgi:hypothetical protein